MKKLFIVSLIGLLSASCIQKYSPVQDPEVKTGAQYLFKAEVETPDGWDKYVWNVDNSLAGVYADGVSNTCYVLRNAFDGKSGEVEIYGKEVSGQIYAYLPYSETGLSSLKEGRTPLGVEQTYCTDAASQIKENYILAAQATDGKFAFRYLCGALRLRITLDFSSPVQSVSLTCDQKVCGNLDITGNASEKLTQASNTVSVVGIGRSCSITEPLDVWIMLPEGSYTGLFVNISSASETVSAVIKGTFVIEKGKQTLAQASAETHNYEGSDFEEEHVHID